MPQGSATQSLDGQSAGGKSCSCRQGREGLVGSCLRNTGGGKQGLELPGPFNKGSQGGDQRQCQKELQSSRTFPVPTAVTRPALLALSSKCLCDCLITRQGRHEVESWDSITKSAVPTWPRAPPVLCGCQSFPEPYGFVRGDVGEKPQEQRAQRLLEKSSGLKTQQLAASNPAPSLGASGLGQTSDMLSPSLRLQAGIITSQ